MRSNYHYEWTQTLDARPGTKEKFIKYLEERKIEFEPTQDWDHRHHNHYDVNHTYQNYREFK